MKAIRTYVTLVGLSLVLFALSTVGARGQVPYLTHFAGTFTLPFEAQWGTMALPVGDYTLEYGKLLDDGTGLVVVRGTEKGSLQVILSRPARQTSTAKNAIVCIREGNTLIVRALEMQALGGSVHFPLPRGAKRVVRNNGKHRGYTQLVEVPVLLQRISATLNAK